MAKADDRRVLKTRAALNEALMQLMREGGFQGISVDDLLDRAEVARSTFYAHYRGKDDLLRETMRRLHGLTPGEEGDPVERVLGFSRAFFEHAGEYRDIYRKLLADSDRGATVFKIMHAVLIDAVKAELSPLVQGGDLLLDGASRFVVGAQATIMSWWLENRPQLDVDEVDKVFRRLARPALQDLIHAPSVESQK